MKSRSNPRRLSLVATLALVGVALFVLLLFQTINFQIKFAGYILGAATFGIFAYFIIYNTIESFIYKKVKLIYKNIHRLKRGKPFNENDLKGQFDMLEDMNKEFMEWAKTQKDEIQHLKTLEQYRRNFLGNVSHELKTPIFNIQGYIMTLLDGGIHDKNINVKYLQKTASSVDRMINIVKDLETISALESGIIELSPSEFNVVDLVREVMDFLEVKANKKAINLHLSKGEKQVSVFALGDKERIRQVLVNLIDNAIKYTGESTLPYIKISFYDMGDNVLVEVSDNGMGIATENIPFLFDRFYRADKARSRDQGGTGLGLSIVKHIIEAHKQTINVRSSVGIGTTFSFTLKKAGERSMNLGSIKNMSPILSVF